MTTIYNGTNPKPLPTQSELKRLFDYHPDGYLTWRIKHSRNVNIGDRAGSFNKDGYTQLMLGGINYYAHRLIYVWHHGSIPQGLVIDHDIDTEGQPKDNRIQNLVPCVNQHNINKRKSSGRSTSGITGVSWYKAKSKWVAETRVNYKRIFLGYYDNKFEAFEAYDQAARLYKGPAYRPQIFTGALLDEYNDYLASQYKEAA